MFGIGTDFLIVIALVVGNGLLAMSEIVVVSSRKVRLQQRAEAGNAGARAALELSNAPNRFLSTVQIGITLVGILAGAFGGATIAEQLSDWLSEVPALNRYSDVLGIGIVVVAITYLSLIVGELVPKRLALQNPERIAAAVARPMRLLALAAAPAVAVLSWSTDAVLRLLGVRPQEDQAATEEEIRMLIEQSTAAGVFESAEQELVASVFRLGDRQAGELMTPRPTVAWLDIEDPFEANWRVMMASSHTLFPLCRAELDTVLGIVSVKDVAARLAAGETVDLTALAREPLFVPDTAPALRVVEQFKQAGTELALVVDEFGGVAGVLTLTDVLEALVGDVPVAGNPHEPRVVRRADGSWLLDGMLPVDELKETLRLGTLPHEGEYQTLAGFVLAKLGRIPAPADHFIWDGLQFEVVDMDGKRVDKVLVVHAAPAAPEGGALSRAS